MSADGSSFVLYELQVGIAKSSSPEKRTRQLAELTSVVQILPFHQREAQVANGRKALVLEFIRRVMFCYYIGNSDAHAMNFSFMRPTEAGSTDADIQLSPIYDVLFTHAFPAEGNLSALALDLLDDSKGGEFFTPQFERLGFYSLADFIELGRRVGIPAKPIIKFAGQIIKGLPLHTALVERSHMPEEMKQAVCALLADRAKALSPRLAF